MQTTVTVPRLNANEDEYKLVGVHVKEGSHVALRIFFSRLRAQKRRLRFTHLLLVLFPTSRPSSWVTSSAWDRRYARLRKQVDLQTQVRANDRFCALRVS